MRDTDRVRRGATHPTPAPFCHYSRACPIWVAAVSLICLFISLKHNLEVSNKV
ncbi:hypothetical protein HMPREF9123_1779 [Neisseria bacilliformis ATCC BAA-1200]|uniref:Uncharacterized protein n=1 Tax=Neisseria bacilliformis ATCC BAA-1200 TaxID=888742 RepID=F2BDH3_9NEIS|nr:hypothetical protein HMPREF9123_1779 [Neisseria bacilliformis ATCC BAA-1200]